MSVISVQERRFENKRYVARQTEQTGWGIFAETDFEEGDPIFWLSLQDTHSSKIVKWLDSFGPCYDRGFTIVPDFGFCCTQDNPFWNMNHSCDPNAGFINWGRPENGLIPIAAHRRIAKGEQITSDYATFTMSYDGTPDGSPWEMSPCLCGVENCRGIVTGFEALPRDLQLPNVLANGAARGRVLAHIVHDLPTLEGELQQRAPSLYEDYKEALINIYNKSAEFQLIIGPSHAPSPNGKRPIS
jgi:hypothetical protein